MHRITWLTIIVMSAFGCTPGIYDSSEPIESAAKPMGDTQPSADRSEMSGEAAYNLVCASCHETGVNGAPVTGDAAAWSHRSQLWQAVLSEHAIDGYLEMPGKGGRSDLSDQLVIAATEYMMLLTYLDRLPD